MSHVLIVGRSFSGLKTYLAQNGHDYTVLQDELTTKFPNKKFKNRVVISFASKAQVLAGLDTLKKPIDAVICTYENYILPASWITNVLNLPGISTKAAEACTDKELMRQLFNAAPEQISPDFKAIKSKEELLAFAQSHAFPLILKPANLAKSLLVTKNDSVEELIENYDKAIDLLQTTYAKYAPNREPKLIIEEFLEGTIHSVDAFVDAKGVPHILEQVVDYQTGYDIGFDDNFHYSRVLPSSLPSEDKTALRHVAKLGCEALGITSSPAHIEIILTKSGPRIVEIGARNGGYRERMHSFANGIDITGNHLALALGNQPAIVASKDNACAVLELFPKTGGSFQGIKNYDTLTRLPSLQYVSVKAKLKTHVGKSADGYKMCAVVIIGSSDFTQFNKDLEYIRSNVSVQTDEL